MFLCCVILKLVSNSSYGWFREVLIGQKESPLERTLVCFCVKAWQKMLALWECYTKWASSLIFQCISMDITRFDWLYRLKCKILLSCHPCISLWACKHQSQQFNVYNVAAQTKLQTNYSLFCSSVQRTVICSHPLLSWLAIWSIKAGVTHKHTVIRLSSWPDSEG